MGHLWSTPGVLGFTALKTVHRVLLQIRGGVRDRTASCAHHLLHTSPVAAQLPSSEHEALRVVFLGTTRVSGRYGGPVGYMMPCVICSDGVSVWFRMVWATGVRKHLKDLQAD